MISWFSIHIHIKTCLIKQSFHFLWVIEWYFSPLFYFILVCCLSFENNSFFTYKIDLTTWLWFSVTVWKTANGGIKSVRTFSAIEIGGYKYQCKKTSLSFKIVKLSWDTLEYQILFSSSPFQEMFLSELIILW